VQGPPAAPPPDNIEFSRFTGIRNTISAERLAPEELQRARNVDIDDAGQIHRRRGSTLVASGNFHSLFESDGGTVYGVLGSALGIINPNYSFVSLATGFGPDHLAYVQVGPTIYFSSLRNSGQITGNAVTPWGEAAADFWFSPVVNPTPTLFPIKGRLFGSPPMATLLEHYSGRIYLGSGRTVWATELYLYNYIDVTKNFWQFEDDLTMIAAVQDGLYVGTESKLYFVTGGAFAEMKRSEVLEDGVLPGTIVEVPKELVDPQGRQDLAQVIPSETVVVFMTTAGLVAGMAGGQVFNLTQTRVQFPVAQTGSALFRKQDGINSYLGVVDSGGTPAGNARLGDYVSAQLIRGTGES
jgi:hypothetical protein